MLPTPPAPDLTVYFDGSCPLCRREISLYRSLRSQRTLKWVDVSAPATLPTGLTCELAMQRFHVQDGLGRVYSGAQAFSVLWRCFAGWRILGWITAIPPFSWLFEGAYRVFLRVRPRVQACWRP